MSKFKALAFLMVLFTFSTCKKEEKGDPGPNEIWFEYKAFHPSTLQVAVGTTVTFTNKDNANHSATETSNYFNSGRVKSGDSWSFTFNTPGTYYFYCQYHSSGSSEQGAIRVQ